MRRVIKFGGASIATPEMVRSAATQIARLVQYGEQIIVVVSAPGNATSELLEAISQASDNQASFQDSCDFAALGEEQSVRLMVAALKSMEISAQAFVPCNVETWPIVADCEDDSPLATAKVNEERPFHLRTQQTLSRFRRFVLPHLRVGTVPVIAGFFAVDSAQHVVALGRGGSDITAFIAATQVSADEVVIVTDVKGVLSADPRLANNPKLLEELSIEDMQVISTTGSRVLHPRALKYRGDNVRVRLLDYRELDQLEHSGTSVLGKSETTLFERPEELSMITLVGDIGSFSDLDELLLKWRKDNQIQQVATSRSHRFACFYLPSNGAEAAYSKLHTLLSEHDVPEHNLSIRGGVGELRLRSAKFIEEPGVLAEVTGVLANARINIIEAITGMTDISVFINYKELGKAEALLRRVLDHFTG